MHTFPLRVQLEATPGQVEHALSVLQGGMHRYGDYIMPEQLVSLASACKPALSNLKVAQIFCSTVEEAFSMEGNLCKEAMPVLIPVLITALSAHGERNYGIASKVCCLLGNFANGDAPSADAIVTCGGLGAIYAAMASRDSDESLQTAACWVLLSVTTFGGPSSLAAVREGRAAELITVAMGKHLDSGYGTVQDYGKRALTKLNSVVEVSNCNTCAVYVKRLCEWCSRMSTGRCVNTGIYFVRS